ncbi:MAG: hypothetical protein H6703_14025, partial [Myxococcales bacterium]|nr:hypothetical protein [Myxococcales bacterium]
MTATATDRQGPEGMMAPSVKLIVRWDGDIPGLPDHRLDLDTFWQPIELLNRALKWVASSIYSDAESVDYGVRGGRTKKQARLLRVQWSRLESGCVTSEFELGMWGQLNAFEDLPQETVT